MIIVFSGLHGTGKSTIAKRIAETLGYKYYSTGVIFREMAKERGMTLEQFSRFAEGNYDIDKELDNRILEFAKTNENYVFDGQMPAYLLGPLANLRILLECEDTIRIERMRLRDGRDFAAQKHETLMREESERQRFIEIYHIDVHDPDLIRKTYDLILDVSHLNIEEVYNRCFTFIKQKIAK